MTRHVVVPQGSRWKVQPAYSHHVFTHGRMRDQPNALSRMLFWGGSITLASLSGCYLGAPRGQREVRQVFYTTVVCPVCYACYGQGPHHCGGSENLVSRLCPYTWPLEPKGLAGSVVDLSGCAIYVVIFAVVFQISTYLSDCKSSEYIADSRHFHQQVFIPQYARKRAGYMVWRYSNF
jgi:hypothetical protein